MAKYFDFNELTHSDTAEAAGIDNTPTAPAAARLEVLAERVRKGLPLWHPEDRVDYAGLTGAVRPRD